MLVGVGARIILIYLFHIQNWIIHIILGVLAALIIPVILQKVSTRINFPYIFELRRNDVLPADPFPIPRESLK